MLGTTVALLAQLAAFGAPSVALHTDTLTAQPAIQHQTFASWRWQPPEIPDLIPDSLQRPRRRAFEYSDGYLTRLGIHRAVSWAMIPLFIGSGYTGFRLRNEEEEAPQWTRDLHGPLAAGTAVVFGMNTLTGVWNLIESWENPEGRGKRVLHSLLFMAAGAGFTYVATAGDNIHSTGQGNHWHRDIALGSMGVSVVSWAMMTLFK